MAEGELSDDDVKDYLNPDIEVIGVGLTRAEFDWLTLYAEQRGGYLRMLIHELVRYGAKDLLSGDLIPFQGNLNGPVLPPTGMNFDNS